MSVSQGIECIDHMLGGQPKTGAGYLLEGDGDFALIEPGPATATPLILACLEKRKIAPAAVKHVIVSHVHLDHAGGAGTIMSHLPAATLVVHPRGVRHMIDPRQLWDGSVQVYGAEVATRIFGVPVAVPWQRIREGVDGLEIELRGRRLHLIETLGHAHHHFSVVDKLGRGIFTGDAFGSSYREFDNDNGPFAYLASNPVQFAPEKWRVSIDLIRRSEATRFFLSHYGLLIGHREQMARDLARCVDDYVEIANRHAGSDDRYESIRQALMDYTLRRLREHGCSYSDAYCRQRFDLDVKLSAAGLDVWIANQAIKRPEDA